MEKLSEYLADLNAQLKKHPDVKGIYKQTAETEWELWEQDLNFNHKIFIDSWNAFSDNLRMLREIEFERQYENKPTLDVLNAAFCLLDSDALSEMRIKTLIEREDQLLLIMDTASMLVIFCVNCQITRRISALLDDDLVIKGKTSGKQIYRGVSNASYNLIPTIYRNISIDHGFGVVDSNKLKSLYFGSNLLPKYKDVFGSDEVDYAFCAFAQHSRQYSPLLDFTEDFRVTRY